MNLDTLREIARASVTDTESGAGAGNPAGPLAEAREKIAQSARDTTARIKSAASDMADRAKSETQRLAQDSKDGAANRIRGYGSAIHESARSLEQQDPNIAWATHRVADRIQGAADYVRNTEFDDMRRDAENLARRHPVIFFGGLFVAGLVLGNILKAREPAGGAVPEDQPEADMGNPNGSADPGTDLPSPTGI